MRPDPATIAGRCPYCSAESSVDIYSPRTQSQLVECWQCAGAFVAIIEVSIASSVRTVEGEREKSRRQMARFSNMADGLESLPRTRLRE